MLQVNYGNCDEELVDGGALKPLRHVALIWTLRIILGVDVVREGAISLKDCLYQLDLLRAGSSGQDLLDALNDKDRCHSRLKALESEEPSLECPLSDNLELIRQALQLDRIEVGMLTFIGVKEALPWFQDICDWTIRNGHQPDMAHCIAAVTKLGVSDIHARLAPEARLVSCGLIRSDDRRRREMLDSLLLAPILNGRMHAERLTHQRFIQHCVRPAPKPSCRLADFDLSGPTLPLIQNSLAVRSNAVDCPHQILIHGPPGTGKTELARALAVELGLELLEVPEADQAGTPMNPSDRIRHFRLAQSLLANQPDKLLIFDEADQVLSWSAQANKRDQESWDKAWINRLLETTSVACIWIANDVSRAHPAILRRFHIVHEMPLPSAGRLARIFRHHTGGTQLSENWLHRLAETGRVTPGLIRNATWVAQQLPHPDSQAVQETIYGVLDGHCRAINGRRLIINDHSDETEIGLPYRPEWLAMEPQLDDLADILERTRLSQVRLLFHGPPGTGKTALARELARRLDKPLVTAPASELLGCFVGETEANLARLFDRAMSEDALLLLDEADSFLQDRQSARQQWQVTQVNELLTQMENYNGLFIAATNRIDALDPACLRRLDVKVKFNYLPAENIRSMCRTILGKPGRLGPGLESRIRRLNYITPADFRTALRRLRLLDESLTAPSLVNALEVEMLAKPNANRRKIGFIQ